MNRRGHPLNVLALMLALAVGATACRRSGSEPQASEQQTPEAASDQGQVSNEAPGEEANAPPAAEEPAPSVEPAQRPLPTRTTSPVPSSPAQPAPEPPETSPVAEPSSPAAAPEPEILEVSVPAGTVLELELLTALDTSVNQVGDEIQARTLSPVSVHGEPVLPKGSYLEGRVTSVQASGKVKGRASLGFTFDRLNTRSGVKRIRTSIVQQEADSQTKKDATIIGGAAGVGALVGGLIGGKKGAAIGATIGGAGGTGVVLTTKGEEIHLPVGSQVNVRLDDSVELQLN
jgi:hypothetical protein